MKCRYIVLIIVVVLVLFGTPTILAISTGDLFSSEDDKLSALLIYPEGTEDDSYTILAVNGVYNAYKKNSNIDVGIYPYPENATDEDFTMLCEVIDDHPSSSVAYDLVIVASPQDIISPEEISKLYPSIMFVYIDSGNTSQGQMDNVRFFDFMGEQSAFLAGYLAGTNTSTNIVGLVMGCESPAINRLRYGFEAGVQYAAEAQGESIECRVSNIETMTDEKKGESEAIKLNQEGNGADIIMNLAGSSGLGVINAAKEMYFYAIGCDSDQSYLAPDNVLCSATKKIDGLIEDILLSSAESKASSEGVSIAESLAFIPSFLDLESGFVNIEGMHSTVTHQVTEIDNLKSAIYKGVLPIPYSKETMATWSVVPITKQQAPLIIDSSVGSVS